MHDCKAEGCGVQVKDDLLMCRRHWYMVPKPLRDAVWETYRHGPRRAYVANVRQAIDAVAARERR